MSQKPCAKVPPVKPARKQPRGNMSAMPAQSRDSFQVVIQCDSEEQQEELYNELRGRELVVRLLTM